MEKGGSVRVVLIEIRLEGTALVWLGSWQSEDRPRCDCVYFHFCSYFLNTTILPQLSVLSSLQCPCSKCGFFFN